MLGSLGEKLSKTRKTFRIKFQELFQSNKHLEEILEELTETMILADVGIPSTEKIIEAIREKSSKNDTIKEVEKLLEEEITKILSQHPTDFNLNSKQSAVIMVGVNGGGKTTSLAKLAYHFKKEGMEIMMVAADTFRAAAQEQLLLWGKKLRIPEP